VTDLPSLNLKLDDPPPAPPPGGKKERKKRGPNKPKGLTDTELHKALEQALVFPSIPSMIFYPTVEGKQYLSAHFTLTAPWGADQLVMASKLSPPLRAQLERIARGGVAGIMLNFAAVWLGGPILFLLGQKQMAEGITMSTQVDEAGAAEAMQAMFGGMMAGPPESPPTASMNGQDAEQAQSDPEPVGAPEQGLTEDPDWAEPAPEPGPPDTFA
jgi:hypothetical protein